MKQYVVLLKKDSIRVVDTHSKRTVCANPKTQTNLKELWDFTHNMNQEIIIEAQAAKAVNKRELRFSDIFPDSKISFVGRSR